MEPKSAEKEEKIKKIDPKILQLMYGTSAWNKNSAFLGIANNDKEKTRILKKILDLSSIKPETVKLLLKLLKGGKIGFDVEDLMKYEREKRRRDLRVKTAKTRKKVDLDFKKNKEKMFEEAANILEQPKMEKFESLLDLKTYQDQIENFRDFELKVEKIDQSFDEELRRVNAIQGNKVREDEYNLYKKNVRAEREKLKDERNELQNAIKYTFEEFLAIIKLFILSPIERKYINNIENEIRKSEQLDSQIDDLSKNIKAENDKKRKEVKDMKSEQENPEKLLRDISIHENKLEKAHQKLNTTISQNVQLRQKIDVLRKEKNVIEDIYNKLKFELEVKRDEIETTIVEAGRAYISRNTAEKELEELQEQAEDQKKKFEEECERLNKSIEKEKKFKKFLKEKQKEEEELEKLKQEIEQNKKTIEKKKESNDAIKKEYEQSAQKELQIKNAFDRISKETGIKDCKDLVEVFNELHAKNSSMNFYVEDLGKELEEIDAKIKSVKEEITRYNTRGATKDVKKHEMKVNLSQKIVQEEKKKQILKIQYEKSLETMTVIKDYLEKLLENVGVEEEKLQDLKGDTVTEEHLMKYFGILEEKGIEIVSEYARLIAEQIKSDKGEQHEMDNQITNLVNIIQYENANILNSFLKEQPKKMEISNDLFVLDYETSAAQKDKDYLEKLASMADKIPKEELMKRVGIQTKDDFTMKALEKLKKKSMAGGVNKSTLSGKVKSKNQR